MLCHGSTGSQLPLASEQDVNNDLQTTRSAWRVSPWVVPWTYTGGEMACSGQYQGTWKFGPSLRQQGRQRAQRHKARPRPPEIQECCKERYAHITYRTPAPEDGRHRGTREWIHLCCRRRCGCTIRCDHNGPCVCRHVIREYTGGKHQQRTRCILLGTSDASR